MPAFPGNHPKSPMPYPQHGASFRSIHCVKFPSQNITCGKMCFIHTPPFQSHKIRQRHQRRIWEKRQIRHHKIQYIQCVLHKSSHLIPSRFSSVSSHQEKINFSKIVTICAPSSPANSNTVNYRITIFNNILIGCISLTSLSINTA